MCMCVFTKTHYLQLASYLLFLWLLHGLFKLTTIRNETRGRQLSILVESTTSRETVRLSLPLQLASNGRLATPLP